MTCLGRRVVFLMMCVVYAVAQESTEVERAAVQSFKVAPSYFIPNSASQKTGKRLVDDAEVSAFIQTQNGRVMFTPSGAVIGMSVPVEEVPLAKAGVAKRPGELGFLPEEVETRSVVMKAGFSAAQAKTRQIAPRLEAQAEGIVNYLIGPKENWRTEIPTYRKLVYDDVWDGIALEYLGFNDRLEFQLVLEPGSNPEHIVMETGGEEVTLLEDGRLRVTLAGAELVMRAPKAFQEINGVREAVTVAFKVLDNQNIGFSLGAYAPDQKLAFNSGLTWGTFLGSSGGDNGNAIAIDDSGNAYVFGTTLSSDFPTTSGAFDQSPNGGSDLSVSKLNSTGTTLIYSTFIGGSNWDFAYKVAVDSSGNTYLTGSATSSDYPTTGGSFDPSFNGSADTFVTKLNSTGTALVYSTFIGGSGNDFGYGIALDSNGNAYVTGFTEPQGFPTTNGAYDRSDNGFEDAFVSKLNSTGTALSYSTLLGGSGYDGGYEIALDSDGNAYVVGHTASTNFPATEGAYDQSHNGDRDVFVTKLNSTGTALNYTTFLGGSSVEYGHGITVDSSGCAYVTGYTESPSFPTTSGAYDESHNNWEDGFVSKLNSNGTALSYSTFLGGSSTDIGNGIAVDQDGNVCVIGYTASTSFPTTSGAYDESFNGNHDVFLSKFDSNGAALSYSTFLGGSGDDYGNGVALDSAANAYVTGNAYPGFPSTSGVYDESFNGFYDVFVAKFTFCAIQLPLWPDSLTILDIIPCL